MGSVSMGHFLTRTVSLMLSKRYNSSAVKDLLEIFFMTTVMTQAMTPITSKTPPWIWTKAATSTLSFLFVCLPPFFFYAVVD